jgi:hypothetical protein
MADYTVVWDGTAGSKPLTEPWGQKENPHERGKKSGRYTDRKPNPQYRTCVNGHEYRAQECHQCKPRCACGKKIVKASGTDGKCWNCARKVVRQKGDRVCMNGHHFWGQRCWECLPVCVVFRCQTKVRKDGETMCSRHRDQAEHRLRHMALMRRTA